MVRRKVSRRAFEKFEGERWNAFNDLCGMSEMNQLTPLQRIAYLAWWYDSEVKNGGHFQYFVNRSEFNHTEVIRFLNQIGALPQSKILSRALAAYDHDKVFPETKGEYLKKEKEADLLNFDREYSACKPEIMDLLGKYLDEHESEFIEWVP